MNDIAGRKALVTGVSREVGKVIAEVLAGMDAEVALNYDPFDERSHKVDRYMEDLGVDTWVYPANLNDLGQALRMKQQITKHFGRIDILINVGGIEFRKPPCRKKGAAWTIPETVRLAGLRNCIRLFMDDLAASEQGRIINIAPGNGHTASKAPARGREAVEDTLQMTVSLARDLAEGHVTVNAIATGFLETGSVARMPADIKKTILALVPKGRFGRPEELAWIIAFLASVNSSYITGQVLRFTGGGNA